MDKSQYEIISVGERDLDRIFEPAEEKEHQSAYLTALYTLMYGFPVRENDAVNSVDGFAKAGQELADALMERAAKFDREYHPKITTGRLMLNNGPSTAEWLSDWEMGVPPLRLENNEERGSPNEAHPTTRVSPGEARGILTANPRRDNSDMQPQRWINSRTDATVKVRHLVEDDARQHATTIGMIAEAIKEPIFCDEHRHAGPKTTLQLAEMLREDGALLYVPSYLEGEYADEQMA